MVLYDCSLKEEAMHRGEKISRRRECINRNPSEERAWSISGISCVDPPHAISPSLVGVHQSYAARSMKRMLLPALATNHFSPPFSKWLGLGVAIPAE